MRTSSQRWMAPTVVGVAGTLVAGALAIGHGWSKALIAEVVTVILSAGYFVLTGRKSDIGAIYAHRSDERQHLVYLRASAVALRVMLLTAFVCALVSVAMNDSCWQADVIGTVGGVAFVIGLATFGAEGAEREVPNGTGGASLRSARGVME
jgi:hypothetical protein